MKTGGVYLGFHTFRGRKFPHGNFRTSVFCEVKTQIVGKTKFFDSLNSFFTLSAFPSASLWRCALSTHLVYQFILVPDAKRNGKRFADFGASFGNLCVHYLTPLLVVAQWLLLADKSSLGWRSALWWLTLPLAYFAFAMLRGRSGKPIGHTHLVYPYPFLDLPRLGWRKFAGSVMGMLLSFFLLGYGMMWLGRLVGTPLA